MKVQDLRSSYQHGMNGCGSYKGTNRTNTLEALQYWFNRGVNVFEIYISKTKDNSFVAFQNILNPHNLKNVEINPYRDNSEDKYSEAWFMRQRFCEHTTGGLTPMNLDTIVNEMRRNPEIIVVLNLWDLCGFDDISAFAKQINEKASDDILDRCILEVCNKKMLAGIRGVNPEIQIMYCVHGPSDVGLDENVNPMVLKELGVGIISFPWACTKDYPGEMEQYHKEGFTIFSVSADNRHKREKQAAGVNVNLVDVIKTPIYFIKALCKKAQKIICRPQKMSMQEMTIEEAHAVALDIMKEVHEFCIENDIQYSLAYGSLIGAIRHKGFIPWDDDIDIWMTRPNFEKFTKTFKSKKGYRHLSIYDKDSLMCFDRVYETEYTYVKNMSKACKGETGIWIDIMLLDFVPDDKCLRDEQYQQFAELNRINDLYRGWLTLVELKNYKEIFKLVAYELINGNIFNLRQKNSYKIHCEQLETMKKYSNSPSSYYCFFQSVNYYLNQPPTLLPAKCYTNYQIAKFEDTEFMIVKDYDVLLRLLYGDYMTPPPLDQQIKSHGICFWK